MAIKSSSRHHQNRRLSRLTGKPKTRIKPLLRVTLLALVMLALLAYNPPPQQACGPFRNDAIFTFTAHPDYPLDNYAAGRLGVVMPTYARSYLFVAYRYFVGTGFDAEEQKALVSLWKHKLRDEFFSMKEDAGAPVEESPTERAHKAWLDARKRVQGAAALAEILDYRSVGKDGYGAYLNCPPDAFLTAAKTLEERITRFGADSVQVKNWLAAQDQVFANCHEGATIPAAESESAPPLVQADRRYQIAAANFYATNFDAAEQMFSQIAADKDSPYRVSAPYLAARALVRKGTLVAEEGKVDAAALTQAEARLRKIIADAALAPMHAAARRTLSFVNYRLKPEAQARALAQALLGKGAGKTLEQDLFDYTALLDKYVVDDPEDYFDGGGKSFARLPKIGREDELTDWLLVFQVADRPALDYALDKWAKTARLPWLVAAISKIDAGNPRAAGLIEAAAKVSKESPAYPTLAYHSLRLMLGAGNREAARQALDALLTERRASLPQSSQNLFLSLRMQAARNLEEMLRYAQRTPAGFSFNEDGREIPSIISEDESLKEFAAGRVAFDVDAYRLFNAKMPLPLLKEAAASRALPAYLRREVAQAAFVKAVLLGEEATGKELAAMLQTLAPEWRVLLATYSNAAPGDDRKMAGMHLILRHPGVEPYVDDGVGRTTPLKDIDNYRDNWWCAEIILGSEKLANAFGGEKDKTAGALTGGQAPEFISAAAQAAAQREYEKLQALGNAPNYLCAEAIRLATAKPADARAPEMLHLAVRATRYGCTDKETGKFSKAAYDLLHKRYPRSEWAAKTKYWYGGQ